MLTKERIEKCEKGAGKYGKKLTDLIDEMNLLKHPTLRAPSEMDYCKIMIEMMHDKRIPRYVIMFYQELYNSIKVAKDEE
jgi:hypothetical protein